MDAPTDNDVQLRRLSEYIEQLSSIGIALSAERDSVALQEQILISARALTHADGGTIYLVSEDRTELHFQIVQTDSLGIRMGGTSGMFIDFPPVPLHDVDGNGNLSSIVAYAVLRSETVVLDDAYDAPGFDFAGTKAFDERTGYRTRSILTIPMRNHHQEIIGVLQLLNARGSNGETVVPFAPLAVRMAEGLASQAAVAMTRRELIRDLHNLFEGFVQLIADAIDKKSPYTGGHCRRVTELTLLLAEATAQHRQGPLATFTLSDADRYELHIAALLHDCGKITTPEWVMDKATRLQGLSDRIELIAARYEILHRDAELACLSSINAGGEATAARARAAARHRQLDEELAFLRRCNAGDSVVDAASAARIRSLSEQVLVRADGEVEALLSPQEVENLSVCHGTLNNTERRIIQDHVVATIEMLENLPYPRHLRRVPEFAGGHHERVDGSGYPRRLQGREMSPQARMMAIADVFEALTAADRPYKRALLLSEALNILGRMKENGQIDPDLFEIFISSGVWRDYAEHYLQRAQIDAVDLSRIPGYGSGT